MNKNNKQKITLSNKENLHYQIQSSLYPPKTSENFLKWSDVLGNTGMDKDVGLMILFNELFFICLLFLLKLNEFFKTKI